jgi:hypothetical protein
MPRRRFKQRVTPADRLSAEARRLREQANELSPGARHEQLMRTARQLDTASRIDKWLASPGLQAPT